MKNIIALCILSLSLCACAAQGVSTYPVSEVSRDYVFGTGDSLRITVFGQTDLSGDFKVSPDGTVTLPLIKDVPAAGMTSRELEQNIAASLSPNYVKNPRVSVEVTSYRDVYVLGEVRSPGKFEYVPNLTVLQAAAIAGGYTYRAQESSAEVTRHVKGALKTFTVDSKAMIKPGDTVVIKRRWF